MQLKFKQEKIKINNISKTLISLLNNVIVTNQFTNNRQKKIRAFQKEKLWQEFLKFIKKTNQDLQKSKYIVLPCQSLELDPSAQILFECYQNYLSTIIKKEVKTTHKPVKNVEDNYILLREILLRMVGIILQLKENNADHSEKMIAILRKFMRKINNKQIFLETTEPALSKKLTDFSIHLATTHNDWINVFTDMVHTIKIIHLPKKAVSDMVAYLKSIKNNISRQILIKSNLDEFTYRIKEDKTILSNEKIMATFAEFQTNISNIQESRDQTRKIMRADYIWNTSKTTKYQSCVCNKINSLSLRDEIKTLFALFNKTNLLLKAEMQVEHLIRVDGWVAILSDFVKIENLVKLFQAHVQECNQYLKLTQEELIAATDKIGYEQLLKYNSISPSPILSTIPYSLAFSEVPLVKAKLYRLIKGPIEQLKEIDAELLTFQSINPHLKMMENCLLVNDSNFAAKLTSIKTENPENYYNRYPANKSSLNIQMPEQVQRDSRGNSHSLLYSMAFVYLLTLLQNQSQFVKLFGKNIANVIKKKYQRLLKYKEDPSLEPRLDLTPDPVKIDNLPKRENAIITELTVEARFLTEFRGPLPNEHYSVLGNPQFIRQRTRAVSIAQTEPGFKIAQLQVEIERLQCEHIQSNRRNILGIQSSRSLHFMHTSNSTTRLFLAPKSATISSPFFAAANSRSGVSVDNRKN